MTAPHASAVNMWRARITGDERRRPQRKSQRWRASASAPEFAAGESSDAPSFAPRSRKNVSEHRADLRRRFHLHGRLHCHRPRDVPDQRQARLSQAGRGAHRRRANHLHAARRQHLGVHARRRRARSRQGHADDRAGRRSPVPRQGSHHVAVAARAAAHAGVGRAGAGAGALPAPAPAPAPAPRPRRRPPEPGGDARRLVQGVRRPGGAVDPRGGVRARRRDGRRHRPRHGVRGDAAGRPLQQRQKNDPTRTRKVRRVAPPSPPPAPPPPAAPPAAAAPPPSPRRPRRPTTAPRRSGRASTTHPPPRRRRAAAAPARRSTPSSTTRPRRRPRRRPPPAAR